MNISYLFGPHNPLGLPQEPDPQFAYSRQVTVFIDLLGFRATEFNSAAKGVLLLKFLQSLKAMSSDAKIEYDDAGGYVAGTGIRPAVTAFSDNIVLSLPFPQDNPKSMDVVIGAIQHFVVRVAVSAFRLGYLIRGGIALGNLYHNDGVVFGEAMIEAYLLESQQANYPRIVVSPSLSSMRGDSLLLNQMIKEDYDGLYCLSYITGLILSSADEEINHRDWEIRTKRWHKAACTKVDASVAELRNNAKLRELAKWKWFRRQLDDELTRIFPRSRRRTRGLTASCSD